MNFQEKIKSVVDQLTGTPAYIGGSWYKLNKAVENVVLPCVMWVNPIRGTMEARAMQILDSPSVMIAFMDKVLFVGDHEDDSKAVADMKALAAEFIIRCNKSGMFDQIKNARYSLYYDKLDVNVVGIALQMEMKEKAGVNICDYTPTLTPNPIPITPIDINSFLLLNDTPDDYLGQAGKAMFIKETEDGIMFSYIDGGMFQP